MRNERFKQAIRLRLLALVLALALAWYAMNPAPSPVRRVQDKEGQSDEERHEVKPSVLTDYDWDLRQRRVMESAVDSAMGNIDDLEWPELIETR